MTVFFDYRLKPKHRIEIFDFVVLVYSFRARDYVERFYGPEAEEIAVARYPLASFIRRS